jgi:sugar phosphate isomerase/epimerase
MMFKLGVITDEISQDFEKAVGMAKEFGLQTVEIRSVWDKGPHALSDTDVAAIQAIVEAARMSVCAIASGFFKCPIDDQAAIAQHYENLRRCAKVAKQLDTRIVRGFTFWNTGQTEQIWPKILEHFQRAIEICEEEDVILGIENEHSTSIATARLLEQFLTDMAHPRIKAVWDPCNEVHAPGGERPYPEGYERIKQWMVHFHLKDAAPDPETGKARCVPVGEGVIDYRGQLRALLASDYQGSVSLETHWRPKELTKEQLDRPGGAAFSETGEYASWVCLNNLVKIVQQIA